MRIRGRVRVSEPDAVGQFKWIAGNAALDFVNTVDWCHDGSLLCEQLRTYADVVRWGVAANLIDGETAMALRHRAAAQPRSANAALRRVYAFRQAVREAVRARARGRSPDPHALSELDQMVREAATHRRLRSRGDAWTWQGIDEAVDGVLWPIAWEAAALLVSDTVRDVRECAGDRCGWLFLDRGRGQRRRWCDMAACGNRAKARRYYSRRRTGRRLSHAPKVD
jgi:predicted RNA-binding Zn ribbon-like protein